MTSLRRIKIEIPILIILGLVFSTLVAFAQATNIGVIISVQKNEKEVKIFIKNSATDMPYKVTTTLSGPNGYTKKMEGIVDPAGQQIIQSFSSLGVKQNYSATISGIPVSGGGSSFGPITYTFETNYNKPGIIESLGGDPNNQTPGTIPDPTPTPSPDPKTNPNTDPRPTPMTNIASPQTVGLSAEQIAADKVGKKLVPCENTCDFNDVLRLINNLITFLITTLFIPIIILLFMYAGFKYITAEGNPSKVANLKKMLWHIIIGMLLVLCSWLIVKTLLSILASDEAGALQFLK